MLKIGLTGGIASGKSLVAGMFTELGAHTVDADELAHDLMRPGEAAYQKIVEKFGKEILNQDGTVKRASLAELAFDQRRPRIYELNGILHPGVIQKQEQWMEEIRRREPDAIVILEAALLLEAGIRKRFGIHERLGGRGSSALAAGTGISAAGAAVFTSIAAAGASGGAARASISAAGAAISSAGASAAGASIATAASMGARGSGVSATFDSGVSSST